MHFIGIFNKLKEVFYDEVTVEDGEEQELEKVNKGLKKKEEKNEIPKIEEVKYKTVDLEPEEEEEVIDDKTEELVLPDKTTNTFDERDLFKSERTFNFVDFNDEEDNLPPRRNVLDETPRTSRVQEALNTPDDTPKVFKPTPVISPIWGVLDKDYKKDEIQEKTLSNDSMSSAITSYDTVRRKAYGTLEDELEDTLNSLNKVTTKDINREINKVDEDVELLDQKTQKIENLINKLDEATDDLDKNMSIQEAEDRVEIQNFDDDEEEEPKVEEESNDKTLTDSTLEHDLFNLIDSMYDKED